MALVQALKERIWLQRLLKELRWQAENAKGSSTRTTKRRSHSPAIPNTTHEPQYHFVHECVEHGDIELEYCPTADMVADAFTKALPKNRHWMLLGRMGMKSARAFLGSNLLGLTEYCFERN
jgi:hypothetical protein